MSPQPSLFTSMEPTSSSTIVEPQNGTASTKQHSGTKATVHKKSIAAAKPHKDTPSYGEIYKKLVDGLKDFFSKNHLRRAVVGLSGGIDSALTLKIAVDALGAENVTTLILPELGITKQENIDHAKTLSEFLGVTYYVQPINNFISDYRITPWKPSNLAFMNTKARVRAVLLYSFANTENALVLGTSNKSEILLGYGTKYGDLAADVEAIGDLYKTEVFKIADYIGLPKELIQKKPSAELSAGQTDEEEIGASYPDLDKVLMRLDQGQSKEECIQHGLPVALVQLVFRRYEENKHKAAMPPIIKAR